jgi:integrase
MAGEVWYFNFREYQAGIEKPTCRSILIGSVEKFPTEAQALREIELKRLDINRELAESTPGPLVTIKMLVSHYRKEELSDDNREEGKASSTKDCYESYLTNQIVPVWGDHLLSEIKTTAVEKWLRGLMCKPRKNKDGTERPQRPMAKGTKAKIRNLMHSLYEHAIRYEFTPRNPITQVRQSSKRERVPEVLTIEEFGAVLAKLKPRERALVLTDAGAGLRRSELMALQWGDINWLEQQANITRSIVHDTKRERVGACKTETSQKPVPLDQFMLDELAAWRRLTEYRKDEDWVFASPASEGKWPYWPDTILKRWIIPAAREAKVTKRIGWHTFRHTYATLLKSNGEDIKVVQELLRHANSKTTLDIYAQALTPAKREAQGKVVQMMRKAAGQ